MKTIMKNSQDKSVEKSATRVHERLYHDKDKYFTLKNINYDTKLQE